ncbi:MAG: hypothetical protein K2L38_04790, partial [Dysosmobacter sp.]|nr:hypothetical protein [Dysosmobacter sp.]
MRMKANLLHKPINFQMDDCLIEKVVELSYEEFSALKIVPLQDQPFIAENKGCMFSRDGIAHCMLALGVGYHDGVLIDAEGYNCARLAAYIVGARDIVNAELDRAVERIVLEGTENTSSGNWIVYFDELAKDLGLMIRPGNGLYEMLEDKMNQRPEVLDVEMNSDCIDVIYGLNFCPNLDEEQKGPPGILPERKAILFDNALSAVLDLYEGDDLFIMLHDSIGLTLEEIGTHHYLREDD